MNSENVGGIHGLAHENEDICVRAVSFTDAYQMVLRNEIDSAIPVIGLQWLALHRFEVDKLDGYMK